MISPVVSGLLRGVQIGNLIRRAAQEREELERRRRYEERLAQIEDIKARLMLEEAGRPVAEGGVVEEKVEPPPDLLLQSPIGTFRRPADPARTVTYGGTAYELYSPEERARLAAQAERFRQQILTEGEAARKRTTEQIESEFERRKREELGVPVGDELAARLGIAPGTKLLPTELDDVLRASAALERLRQSADGGAHGAYGAGGGQETVSRWFEVETPEGNIVAVPGYKTGRLGAPQPLGKRPREKEVHERKAKEFSRWDELAREAEQEEEEARQRMLSIGRQLNEFHKLYFKDKTPSKGYIKDMDLVRKLDAQRIKLEGEYEEAKRRAEEAMKRKQRYQQLKDKVYRKGPDPLERLAKQLGI